MLPPAAKDQIAVALQGDVATLSDAQVTAALAGQPPEIVNEVVRINAEARNRHGHVDGGPDGGAARAGGVAQAPKGRLRPEPEPVATT